MKKCAILSIYHKNYNYGGQYQAYAYCKALEMLGYNAEEIDYVRQGTFYLHKIKTVLKETPSVRWNYYGRYLNRFLLKRGIHANYTRQIISKFDRFMDSIPHTKPYYYDTVAEVSNDFNIFFSGSDQVWNPDDCPDEYFYSFLPDQYPRIAYSVSIGREELDEQEKKRLKPLIEKYKRIGVRENEAKKLLDSFVEVPSEVVLDPVMLLTKEQWQVFDKWDFLKKEKYACVYLVSYEKSLMQEILTYTKKMGIKAVFVTDPRNVLNQNPKGYWVPFKDGVGPEELIALMLNAQFIFTNSFHGIALSINFEKDFWAYYSRPANDKKKLNSRINTILDNTKLKNRLLNKRENVNTQRLLSTIDYSETNFIINEMRKHCLDFLRDAVEEYSI